MSEVFCAHTVDSSDTEERSVCVKVVMSWFMVIVWMGMIFALSSVPSLASPLAPTYDFILRKLAHLTVYAVLTVLLCRAFRLHVASPTYAWLLAGLVAVVYASSDEWHQLFVPGRHGSLRDVGIDAVGIAGAYALMSKVCARWAGAS
jgi:VanZ family protein